MKKRLLSIFMILTLIIGVIAGCSSSKTTNEESSGASEGKKFKTDEITIYIRMMEMQDKWFRENIIKSFEKKYGVKVNVRTYETSVDLENVLKLDKDKKTIALVKTLHSDLVPFVEKGLMMDLESAVGDRYKKDIEEYIDIAVKMGTINGKVYYIPRKIETNTLLYLKSKVKDAVENWTKFENEINEMFKAENGVGLPEGYTLEKDPNKWDWYDLAVVGYYWANTEYDGKKEPRIAHRAKRYEGSVTELMTKVYQAGGTQEDALKMNTDPVKDTMKWEVFFKKNNLYNPGMWEEGWSGGNIWEAMAKGKVYLAFMHQIDAFFIHGGSNPNMTGYLADPDDMGLAIMPKGVSLELENGKPVREGSHASQLAGFWWGIPTSTPDPELSYELARWITNAENHKAEAQQFGMMPIRKDIVDDLEGTFAEEWMQEVFDIANKQVEAGVQPIPQVSTWPEYVELYLNAWYDIVVEGKYDVDQGLDEVYGPQAAKLNQQ
jgi:ABC-type glycerol-3-phosphate transport system substrate-binding protein